MTKKTRKVLLSAFCGLIFVYGGPVQATEYNIAIVQALTGQAAFIGIPVRNAMLLAIDEINQTQALGPGNTIKAVVEDDANDRNQIVTLVSRYGKDPKYLVFAGPTSGTMAGVAAKLANEEKIPLLAITNTDETRAAGPWSFITVQTQPVVMNVVANYAAKKANVKTCQSITILENESYVQSSRIFMKNVSETGVKTLPEIGVASTQSDFSAVGLKVVNDGADCLYISAQAAMAANIMVQLRQAGLDPKVKVFGATSFGSPDLVRIGGAAVEGLLFNGDFVPGGDDAKGKSFSAEMEKRYGRPVGNWEAVGYSAIQIIAAAIKNAGPNPTRETIRDALAKTKDVPVLIGDEKYSLDSDKIPHYGVAMLTVRDGKFVAAPKE